MLSVSDWVEHIKAVAAKGGLSPKDAAEAIKQGQGPSDRAAVDEALASIVSDRVQRLDKVVGIPLIPADPPPQQRMLALLQSFPTCRGFKQWEPARMRSIADDPYTPSSMRHVCRFALDVWNGNGGFQLRAAFDCWDSAHKAAFQAWAAHPFFC